MKASFKCVIGLLCAQFYLLYSVVGSTCPGVFHFETMDRPPRPEDLPLKGVITVQPPLPIKLKVTMQISFALRTRYPGRLELADRVDFLERLNSGNFGYVRYNLFYPKSLPLPQIIKIEVNNNVVCSITPMPARVRTTVILEHTLRPIAPDGSIVYRPKDLGEKPDGNTPQINYPNSFQYEVHSQTNPFLNSPQNQFPSSSNFHAGNQPSFPRPNSNDFVDSPTHTFGETNVPNAYTTTPPFPYPNRIPSVIYQNHPKHDPIMFNNVPATVNIQNGVPGDSKRDGSHPGASFSKTCGKTMKKLNPLIAQGTSARRGDWPWMVPLFKKTDLGVQFLCSSTLISDQFIVTAAHCAKTFTNSGMETSDLVAYVGRFNIRRWSEDGTQPREISEIHIHPDYNSETLYSDVALLKLQQKITMSPFVNPACFWPESEDLSSIVGRKGVAFGWGTDGKGHKISDIPKLVMMPIVSQEECLQSKLDFKFLTSNRTFCAGNRDGSGPCNGDSGGGLLLPGRAQDGTIRWYLRGLISLSLKSEKSGLNTCNLYEYIVFTDLAKYKNWFSTFIPNIV